LHLDITGKATWGYNARGKDIEASLDQIKAHAERILNR